MLEHSIDTKIVKKNFYFSITKHYVNMTLENLKTKASNSEEEKSILEKLLEIDENVAHIMSMDMLVAGIDTVGFPATRY